MPKGATFCQYIHLEPPIILCVEGPFKIHANYLEQFSEIWYQPKHTEIWPADPEIS